MTTKETTTIHVVAHELLRRPEARQRLRLDRAGFAAEHGLDESQLRALESGDAESLAAAGVDVARLGQIKDRPRGRVTRALAALGISVAALGSSFGFGFAAASFGARMGGRVRATRYSEPDYGNRTGSGSFQLAWYSDDDYGNRTGGRSFQLAWYSDDDYGDRTGGRSSGTRRWPTVTSSSTPRDGRPAREPAPVAQRPVRAQRLDGAARRLRPGPRPRAVARRGRRPRRRRR